MVAGWTAATAGHKSIDKVDSSKIMEEQSKGDPQSGWLGCVIRGQSTVLQITHVKSEMFILFREAKKWAEVVVVGAAENTGSRWRCYLTTTATPTQTSSHQPQPPSSVSSGLCLSTFCICLLPSA